ncbi:hypothetical protein [Mucilaginibacter sp. dw_454]|uniref:hypothetical protein n=1 Tax=Mucilaginibacter sp. dw_454 TaxID=2720079 RepID=UPI001BD62C8D|nr:hypothetical protein [Mucilaginibacter sp. dw_454]
MKRNMDMQDKDFDKIFNSKFEDFEVEPSPMVWDNIADELDNKKGKRSWMPYLSIAALLAVICTAGLLLLQKETTGEHHHSYANSTRHDTVKSLTQTAAPVVKQPEPVVVDRSATDRVASNSNHQHKNVSPVTHITEQVTAKKEDAVNNVQAPKANPQLIAQVTAPINDPVKPIMPDVQLAPKTIDIAATPVERPAVMASAGNQENEPVKKRGIHNLGGLINVLVAKVDKRQDKLIEFSDDADDDAETSVTGVNIGPLKIKKQ